VVKRVGFAEVATRIELVVPDFAGGRAFLKEEHDRLHARALERAARTIEHGVEVAAFQQQLAQAHGSGVGVGEGGGLGDNAAATASLEHLYEVLEEEKGGFACADRKILLHLFAFVAAEWWIGQYHVVAVFLLNIG